MVAWLSHTIPFSILPVADASLTSVMCLAAVGRGRRVGCERSEPSEPLQSRGERSQNEMRTYILFLVKA